MKTYHLRAQVTRLAASDDNPQLDIVARTDGPADVGVPLYHDLDGGELPDRVSLDYEHDPRDIVGYADQPQREDGQIRYTGHLISLAAGDRAAELDAKLRAGIPYAASIAYRAEIDDVYYLDRNEEATVNGRTVNGPAIIVRQWHLDNIALTPRPADLSATAKLKELAMSKATPQQNLSTTAEPTTQPATDAQSPATPPADHPANDHPANDQPADDQPANDQPAPAAESTADQPTSQPAAAGTLSRNQLSRYVELFGEERAAKYLLAYPSEPDALRAYADELKAENHRLRETAGELGADPAAIPDAPPATTAQPQTNVQRLAAHIRLPAAASN